mmetsp:Transcript_88051/g.138026  ORF Transcript_88051/g.138026 Transcript_88051/m.138026 type:complete len:313 (+) Transcript_88051:101-1039(+)
MQELQRCRSEFAEAQAATTEREACEDLELHDARLVRVRLAALLQRYRERKPSVEDLARSYEVELSGVEAELRLLREENGVLATGGAEDIEAFSNYREAEGYPNRTHKSNNRAPTVVEELHQEACQLRLLQMQARKRSRRTKVGEWSLKVANEETKKVASRLKAQEQRLQELRSQHMKAETYLRELLDAQMQSEQDLDAERERVRELHRDTLSMREACYLPARLKKETTFLVKMLDQEGGRLKTSQHLRSLQACKRLYDEVAQAAPNLLPLAGRAKTQMEEEFARYMRLEYSHCHALQRLHLALTRGLQRPQD